MEPRNPQEENRWLREQLFQLFSGDIVMPPMPDLESENQLLRFLLHVQAVEADNNQVTILEYLDYPAIKPLSAIPAQEVEHELQQLTRLLQSEGIYLHITGNYPPATIYQFITGTLLLEEVSSIRVDNLEYYFFYEDYHPNAEEELKALAKALLRDWFQRRQQHLQGHLPRVLNTPDGKLYERLAIVEKWMTADRAEALCGRVEVTISQCQVQGEAPGAQTAMVSGNCKNMEPESPSNAEQPFSLHFKRSPDDTGWQLYYFELPGFDWKV